MLICELGSRHARSKGLAGFLLSRQEVFPVEDFALQGAESAYFIRSGPQLPKGRGISAPLQHQPAAGILQALGREGSACSAVLSPQTLPTWETPRKVNSTPMGIWWNFICMG
jgi:hypothetical protein